MGNKLNNLRAAVAKIQIIHKAYSVGGFCEHIPATIVMYSDLELLLTFAPLVHVLIHGLCLHVGHVEVVKAIYPYAAQRVSQQYTHSYIILVYLVP